MVTVESFFKSLRPSKISRDERRLLAIWSNNKLIYVLPHFGYHHTLRFLRDGKVDFHLTKEGKERRYKPYGVFDFALFLKRSSDRINELMLTSDLSFPYEKAKRNNWKCYSIIFPEMPSKKIKMSEFLKTKIKMKKIKLSDVKECEEGIVYTKNGTFKGFFGKDSKFISRKFLNEMKKIFNEEYRRIEQEKK